MGLKYRDPDSGEFVKFPAIKGDKGDSYEITDADYAIIADMVISKLDESESEEY